MLSKRVIWVKQIVLLTLLGVGILLGGAAFQPAQASGALVINEMMTANPTAVLDPQFTNFNDWIELYNGTAAPINLGGYYLTDTPDLPRQWRFPTNTMIPANGYLLIWADGENTGLHTNFKLSNDGEIIVLYTPADVEVTRLDYRGIPQERDVSYGRLTDGGAEWGYFEQPTPAASNQTAVGLSSSGRAPLPLFSHLSGHYTTSQLITLSLPEGATGQIRYTADGSIPTLTSPLYTAPIPITQTTPLRARTFHTGVVLPSETATASYLLNITHTLPIISLAVNPAYFFSDDLGIYVEGPNYNPDDWKTANYAQSWTRAMSMEFFETDGTRGFQIDTGVEIFGNTTRTNPIKSLEVKMGAEYGESWLDYPVFDDIEMARFKRLLLRNSGNDWRYTYFRDALTQSLVEGRLNMDTQAYRPAIVYLNGEFWGIHNIREKEDENYIRTYYGVDPDEVDIIKWATTPQAGNNIAMVALRNYLETNSLANPVHYAYVASQMDIDNFLDYQITEIYVDNRDWPHNNTRIWRERVPNGRWRWMLFDTDGGFGFYSPGNLTFDTLTWATNNTNNRPDLKYTLFLRKLLENQSFREEFIQRFASHINITFAPSRVTGMIDEFQATLEPEMPAHIAKWGNPSSMASWTTHRIVSVRDFANNRPNMMFTHINSYFVLSGTAALTVHTIGQPGDTVHINSVPIPHAPFTGPYFRHIPIRLEAVPQAGQRFVRWQNGSGVPLSTSIEYFLTIDSAQSITAVFAPLPPVTINEIHYHPAGFQNDLGYNYEFLELHLSASYSQTVALEGYQFTQGISYTFPAGATIAPGQYIIVAKEAAAYATASAPVYEWASGSLANEGEQLELRDNLGRTVDIVEYGSTAPWSTIPSGEGPSLALKNPSLDNALFSSWEASLLLGGTPGLPNDYLPPEGQIRINEIHYNPAPSQGSNDLYEFLELHNRGETAVNLSGWRFAAGINHTFANGTIIQPGQHLVLAKHAPTYSGLGYPVVQWQSGSLSNSGEWLWLVDANSHEVDAVWYKIDGDWPAEAHGQGSSLELKMNALHNRTADQWEPSIAFGGTPGRANNRDVPALTAAPTTAVFEDGGWVVVPVQMEFPLWQPASVGVQTSDGTAVAGSDYTAVNNTLTIPVRGQTATILVPLVTDNLYELDETFTIHLHSPNGVTLPVETITATILNDDAPPVFSAVGVTVTEGETAAIVLQLDTISGLPATVAYATADDTALAGIDYQSISGTAVIPAGQTSITLTISTLDNSIGEPARSFFLVLSDPEHATVATTQVDVIILDDDPYEEPLPSLSVDNVTVTEGEPAILTLTLSEVRGYGVWVDVATADGTATAPADYHALVATLHFPAGTLTQTVSITTVDDALIELEETFTLILSNPINAELEQAVGTVTIVDNDGLPQINTADVTLLEGNMTHTIQVMVTLSVSHTAPVSVGYATADGTAVAGVDYESASGQLTFAPSQTVQTIALVILGNTAFEPDKTFTLTLANPIHATLGNSQALIKLLNDDEKQPEAQQIFLPFVTR